MGLLRTSVRSGSYLSKLVLVLYGDGITVRLCGPHHCQDHWREALMGVSISKYSCGCAISRPDGNYAKITFSLGKDCPQDETHKPYAKALEMAKERDERNALSVEKGRQTRARNKDG